MLVPTKGSTRTADAQVAAYKLTVKDTLTEMHKDTVLLYGMRAPYSAHRHLSALQNQLESSRRLTGVHCLVAGTYRLTSPLRQASRQVVPRPATSALYPPSIGMVATLLQ